MMKLETLWNILMYDSSPGEKLHAARIAFRLSTLVFVVWGVGLFSPIGFAGFAKANEVDNKIKAAVDPIYDQLGEVKTKLETGEKMQRRILAAQISAQIRDLHRLKCSTPDEVVRSRMERDVEEAQQEYIELTHDRYPLPACKDL